VCPFLGNKGEKMNIKNKIQKFDDNMNAMTYLVKNFSSSIGDLNNAGISVNLPHPETIKLLEMLDMLTFQWNQIKDSLE
jgi:hypothetical protein